MEENKLKRILHEFKDLDFEERQDVLLMLKARDMHIALDEIWNKVFRPSFKHGYSDEKLNNLIEACGEDEKGYSNANELIWRLGELYNEIIREYDLPDL